MGAKIHRTAQVHSGAELGDEVIIGEYAVIENGVRLDDCVEVGSHAIVAGTTSVGEGTRIFHCAAIGLEPQDLKYRGEHTKTTIGSGNTIREFVTIHSGTADGESVTKIGENNMLMAYVHVAHDCSLGNNLIIANAANMGGHTVIDDGAIIGGLTAIHQFVHIGFGAMVGAASLVLQDVLPYALVSGNPASVHDVNRIGMRRKNIPRKSIDATHKAITILTRMGLQLRKAVSKIKNEVPITSEVERILLFIENRSARGIMRGDNRSIK